MDRMLVMNPTRHALVLLQFMGPYRTAPSRVADDVARIAAIASVGGVCDLFELLRFLPPEASPLGHDAADAVTKVLARARPRELVSLDRSFRGLSHLAGSWSDIALGGPAWGARFPGVVALASMHADGRVRQHAVELLAAREDGGELAFLVIRTNDWVLPVRAAALAACDRRLVTHRDAHWVAVLDVLERTFEAQRHAGAVANLVLRVHTLLRRKEARVALSSAIRNPDVGVRRVALRIALGMDEAAPVLFALTNDPDASIARAAAKNLVAISRAHATLLLSHPRTVTRLVAIETVARGPYAGEALERALFDDARCIRELARFELGRVAPRDFAPLYAASVARGLAALEGLAETATAREAGTLRTFSNDPRARARAAAIAGLGRTGAATNAELEAALRDGSRAVRSAAFVHAKLRFGKRAARDVMRATKVGASR
jgi:hypothetical protein